MNKAFEKAIYDSGLIADGCWDKFDEYDKAALMKAFELVVRECIKKIEDEAVQYAEPVWAFELVNDIKEHFGVKP
jgi:hypothetical protein